MGKTELTAGLTTVEAKARLLRDGPNAMPDTSAHLIRDALSKFWAPVPWLLEVVVIVELALHNFIEASVFFSGRAILYGLWGGAATFGVPHRAFG